jgi:hypothetical protein
VIDGETLVLISHYRYLSEGMDESEFVEACTCLTDLIHAYKAHERPHHTTASS